MVVRFQQCLECHFALHQGSILTRSFAPCIPPDYFVNAVFADALIDNEGAHIIHALPLSIQRERLPIAYNGTTADQSART
jgi:hypothetical protein